MFTYLTYLILVTLKVGQGHLYLYYKTWLPINDIHILHTTSSKLF